jgi:hypothetical protein
LASCRHFPGFAADLEADPHVASAIALLWHQGGSPLPMRSDGGATGSALAGAGKR